MNVYQPRKIEITKIIQESPTIKTLVFNPHGEFRFQTGQFVNLTFPGVGEAPFTPSSDPQVTSEFEVTIMKVGKVTSLFHEAKVGDVCGLRGPFGNGYPLDEFEGKEILIVGGGVGLAPLRSLLLALFSRMEKFKKIYFRYGARTPQDIIYKDQLPQWQKKDNFDMFLTVDQGDQSWQGHVGLVTTILEDLPLDVTKAVVIVCGPPIMMKFTTLKLLEIGFPEKSIYLSMEKNMSCGMGMCGHCRLGKYYVCKDGPVFTFHDIKDLHDIWD